MKIIAHRGNINGPDKAFENSPSIILDAISAGYDVEIDIWYINNHFLFGHDRPDYLVSLDFIKNIIPFAWFHCKNLEAFYQLPKHFLNVNYFWHQNDDFTMTSSGHIWTFPGKQITDQSILVLPETLNDNFLQFNPYGICTDYANDLNKKIF